jgi:secreted PhoX family phosphatase
VSIAVFDLKREKMVDSFLALRGTIENCNGGATPRGTWLTCEESTEGLDEGFERPHGYVFEVPAHTAREVNAEPIVAMGRFTHEAAVTDPESGIVYMTEDNGDPGDGFYRFVPKHRNRLHEGGRRQMLAIDGRPGFDTSANGVVGMRLRTFWVDIDDPNPADAEARPSAVYDQGASKGGARFLGLEGASVQDGHVYFTASEAGLAEQGQVWRFTPRGDRGDLVLLYESADASVLNQPDGLNVSTRGGILLCEDGDGEDEDGGDNFLRGLTPDGRIFDFAKNITPLDLHAFDDEDFPQPGPIGAGEFAGATWSPDGEWLFVNVPYPGVTVAITGPWERGCL